MTQRIVKMSGPNLEALRVKVLEGLAARKSILLNNDETVEFVEAKLIDTKAMARELSEQLEGQEVSIEDAEADEINDWAPLNREERYLAEQLEGQEVSIEEEEASSANYAEAVAKGRFRPRYFETYLGEVPQPEDSEHDPVNHPKHYNSHPSGVECIEITRHMGFNLGNVIKYLWRDGLKDSSAPMEDLYKALWYLQDEIAMREESGQ